MASKTTPTKKKAPARSTANWAFQREASNAAKSTRGRGIPSRSTANAAQYARIVSELRSGPKNTIQLRKAGAMACAARIKEMRDKLGYDIPTVALVTVYDEEGFAHPRVAVYELVSEPEVRGG